ncbi:hybrid sensor histidine kinase/response regulator [Crocosphaera sp.]|uniref:hybrid sensor histidine kinase/response regulator n=1 Tax=Crocosphaera sp. TaxID=2729996 RepID=UPI0026326686|nr:hybrid sensor histidine kinase/response regulator [Crocosphaera sp.]MDJ0580459.1 hybrid sensor histidine kinase/response regulator [Crocosphaera sp.]
MLTLKQFLYSVPTCSPAITYQQLQILFQCNEQGHDSVVVVNAQRIPLGIIFSRDFLLSLLNQSLVTSPPINGEISGSNYSPSSVDRWDWETCMSPLTLIPCDLNVFDLVDLLKANQQVHKQPNYGLVDRCGRFLGLLDSWKILQKVLAENSHPQPELGSLKNLIIELLEELPLPVMLQTHEGEIIQKNRSWREQIGEFIPPDQATACPLPQKTRDGPPQAISLDNIHNYCQTIASNSITDIACKQSLKAKNDLETFPLSTVTKDSKENPGNYFIDNDENGAIPICEKDKIWQFIKCPLTTDKLSNPISIFVATDVTQQQQLCQELAAKNADLVQLNRLKDEFLACISHELKSPLTAVVGLSSLLQEEKIGQLNSRQVHYAQLIYRSGRQLMTLVNDLLDLTRLETGQLKLSFVPVNIKEICKRAYNSITEKYQNKTDKPVDFSLEIEPKLEHLLADELRLHQMLVHLLDNAMKFTQTEGKIGLKVNRWSDWLAFTVWDTGIGIPEESQHLIFQKFQQLENPLTRQFEGTGLGLVLTQRLARAHGGEISFVSKTGQGSQFTLLLPPSPHKEERSLHDQSYQRSNPLILIVEAIPQSIESLMDKLTQLGYRVMIARTGTEAVEKARQLRPYAIFLNPLLPLLSGWDVLTLLKSDPQTQNIRVLVTQTQGHQLLGEHRCADGFIKIPTDLSTLEHCLKTLQPKRQLESRSLTILSLIPNFSPSNKQPTALKSRLEGNLIGQLSQFNHRIVEADDLDQASLLVSVWDIDVIVLDGQFLDDSLDYLRSLAKNPELLSLPLVVLDVVSAQAANNVKGLSVFPCLISDDQEQISQLCQVISIAASQLNH